MATRYGVQPQGAVVTTQAGGVGSTTASASLGAGSGWKTADYIRFGLIIQKELGRPHRARSSSDRSLDCSEFTRSVFAAYDNRQLPRTAAEQATLGVPVDRKNIDYGDLIFFRTNGQNISHVGIAVGFGEFMHVSEKSGVIVSSLSESYWAQRFAGARRIVDSKV